MRTIRFGLKNESSFADIKHLQVELGVVVLGIFGHYLHN